MFARKFVGAVALMAAAVSVGHAQVLQPYDLGGASRPKPDLSFRKDNQYKRVHQSSLRFILRGEIEKTQKFLEQYLAEHPGDAETLYMLGVLWGQKGDLERGETLLKQALAAGLPDGRLVAGPRQVMQPLLQTPLLQDVFARYRHQPVHGPMLGCMTGTSAAVWVRTAEEADVVVTVAPVDDPSAATVSATGRTRAGEDYTGVVVVEGLKPETEYRYELRIDGKLAKAQSEQTFRTVAAAGRPSKFQIAFGGGAGYVPPNERMWDTIRSFDPHALLLLGDNVYIDDPESVVMQQYTYQRRQSRPEWRRLTARTPVFTIWDDHDFSTDDSWGGPDIDIPFWKKEWVFPIFRQNWANPGYGGGDEQPGCWYSFQIGDVDFIMLDCRYYRTDPRKSPRSMLGPVQKEWLKQQLLNSRGTFKVLVSSVPWDFRTKGDSLDTWNGFKEEHDEILGFIAEHRIEGVVLMSADRHRSDAWKISRPGAYDLYEFNSSRLTNQHVHPTMKKQGAIFSYNKLQSFGLVTFDTLANDPQVSYDVINIDGDRVHTLTVRRSELSFR